jgi:EAL domain-containing protein (putative c-di-GMP-specific phosphodiesterase class I)
LSRDKEIKLSQDVGINEILSELDENQREDYPYLVNVTSSFDHYDALIDSLVSTASNYPGKAGKNLPIFYLDVLKRTFSAEIVYLCSVADNNSEVLFASSKENHSDSIDPKRIHDEIIRFYPRIFKIRSPVHIPLDINSHVFQNVPCSLIPLRTDEKSSDLLVVYNYSIGTKLLDITMGTILQALYEGSKHFQKKTGANELKIAIADKLKQTFNYVSEKLFNFRLNLFKDALKTIEMYFEPILQFDKLNEGVSIWGWEALARHKITKKVPVDILRGAEFWGLHFQTELDMYCLEHAVQKYYNENRKLKNFRYGEVKPLTVNVFPNTILRTAYQKLLDDLIKKDKLIPKNTLVLEISEKTLIQALTPSEEEIFLQDFQKRMQRLKKQYGINFAIDDFGVGNSSIARLNKLLPGYVKIDRDILHYDHDLGKQLIKYVNSVAENVPGIGVHIVIEGLDDHSKISLPELIYELDIEYVQGHKFSRARPVIATRLEKEIYRGIYEKLQWEFNS